MLLSFGQGSLRRAVPRRPLPAASSRWLSATSLPVCTGVPAGQLLRHGAPAGQQLLPDAAAAADLSAGVTPRSGAATFPHRLPLRSIPPPRFACGASHSRGTWASTVCAEEFPTPLEMSLHGLHLLKQTQIFRPICTDCLRHLRISAG